MFTDMELVREMQRELDNVIRLAVTNITELSKKRPQPAETRKGVVQGRRRIVVAEAADVDAIDADEEAAKQRDELQRMKALSERVQALKARKERKEREKTDKTDGKPGSLAARLIDTGLLTPDQLQQLKKELVLKAPDKKKK